MASAALRRSGQILTGLTALLTVLALLLGTPVALALLGGNPLPDHLPNWTQVADTLMRPDDGSLFISALTIVGWIAWVAFAVPVIVEALARLRGVRTPQLPGLGGPQRVAAGLLAAITLMIASPAVSAAASTPAYAAPPAAAPAVAAPHTTVAAPMQQAGPATARHTAEDSATYEVRRGDYLSTISERVLGDADRYPELAALNTDHIDDPDVILPGWQLKLPDDATDHGVRAHARGHVDEPAAAAPAHSSAQPDTTQPGTSPPDTGQAGSTAAPTTAASLAATPTTGAPGTAVSTPAAPGSTANGAPAQAATPAAPTAGTPHATEHDDSVAVPVTAAVTGMSLLALLTLLTLRRRRARQQQHRRPRRRIAQPVDGTTEAKLRVAATLTDLDRLDVGLRLLAAGLADRPDEQWPDVVAAWLEPGAVHLVLTTACPAPPPAPWLGDGEVWTLPAHVPVPAVAEQLAPLPTLVALGSQPEQHLLVDLERLGMLTLTGDHDRALDLLRYIAGELAHNHWSDDVHVTLAGFDSDEAQLLRHLNPDRITIADSIESAVAKLCRQLDDTRTALQASGAPTTVHGRATDSGEAWPPQVLLIAAPITELQPTLANLEERLSVAPSSGFAAVVAGGEQTHGRWPVTVTADGHLQVSFLTDSPLVASALPAAMLQPLADLLQTADITDDEPTPPAPDTEDWAAGTDAAGGLRDMLDVDEAEDTDDTADVDGPAGDAPAVGTAPLKLSPRITDRAPSGPTSWSPPTESVLLTLRPAAAVDPEATERRRRDREHRDPHLDDDLAAWAGADPARPRIGILGLVEITAPGTMPKNRHRFYGELIVYLAARGARGATAAQLEDAIWREQEANSSTRRSAISRARTWLGDTTDGGKWMPQMGTDQLYRIAEGYLFDWALFRRLRARGEARADAGAADLRQALELVRGAPFDGVQDAYTADRTAYAWLPDSEIAPTHLVAAIVDTAHQLVELSLAAGDLAGARWALERAWRADPDRYEDQPWRDAMRIAHADRRDSELKALLQDLLRHRDAEVPEDLDPGTFRLVQRLTAYPHKVAS